jgi:hypothetical protein
VPHNPAVLDEERLRGFVSNSETLGDCIGQAAVFDHQHDSGPELWNAIGKIREVLVDVSADRTLRAMLENENGIGFGSLQELVEILILM